MMKQMNNNFNYSFMNSDDELFIVNETNLNLSNEEADYFPYNF